MTHFPKPIAILVAVIAFALGDASLAANSGPEKHDTKRLQAAWRIAITRTPPPGKGCFRATYPIALWREVKCVRAPRRPYLPASGHAVAGLTGNGNDYAAVSKTLISFAVGSFPESKHLKWEKSGGKSNVYSLQLNSNFIPNDPACSGAANPAVCLGWEQFVYSSSSGTAFIQYWLIHYGNQCPQNWIPYEDSCYINSDAVQVPLQPITELPNLKLSGHAAAQGINAVVLTTKTDAYSTTGSDNVVYLAEGWNASEFNVFGDCCRSEAAFNAGALLTVEIDLTNGSTKKGKCAANGGTTAETNNLSLEACKASGGTNPSITFKEIQGILSGIFDPVGSTEVYNVSVNNGGTVAGSYRDQGGRAHGFIRQSNGDITSVDAPGSTGTAINAISENGSVTGEFSDGSADHGFVLTSSGGFTAFDVPGEADIFPSRINSTGSITGEWWDGSRYHGFIRQPDGTITSFDPPGSYGPLGTSVADINDSGTVVGSVFDGSVRHGYIRSPDGVFTLFDAPGAQGVNGTGVSAINASGLIIGGLYDSNNEIHGFIRDVNGNFTILDAPQCKNTTPISINAQNEIVGIVFKGGFLRMPDGSFEGIVPPPGTIYPAPEDINDFGEIVGYARDARNGNIVHGFLVLP
jgi:hypothetical protein